MPARKAGRGPLKQVVDYETGRPLPKAALVAIMPGHPDLGNEREEISFMSGRKRMRALLTLALKHGRRIRLDKNGIARLPKGVHFCMAVSGSFISDLRYGVRLAPRPLVRIPIEIVGPKGRPMREVRIAHAAQRHATTKTDRDGCAVLELDSRATRDRVVVWGIHSPGVFPDRQFSCFDRRFAQTLDWFDHRSDTVPVRLSLPPTATLRIRTEDGRGRPFLWDQPTVSAERLFGSNQDLRLPSAAETIIGAVPLGTRLQVYDRGTFQRVKIEKPGLRTVVVRVRKDKPMPMARFRLLDPDGGVIRRGSCWPRPWLNRERGLIELPVKNDRVYLFVRHVDLGEAQWQATQRVESPFEGVQDLKMQRPRLFATGQLVDTDGQPVKAHINLTPDGNVVWSTRSDARGNLTVWEWFDPELKTLRFWRTHGLRFLVPHVRRGERGVKIVVERWGKVLASLGGLPTPFVPLLKSRVRLVLRRTDGDSAGKEISDFVHPDGRFARLCPAGTYDARVVDAKGTCLASCKSVQVVPGKVVEPPGLQRIGWRESHRHITVRFVDRAGRPFADVVRTVPNRDPIATYNALVPAKGLRVDLGWIRPLLQGDCKLSWAPTRCRVKVRGIELPPGCAAALEVRAQHHDRVLASSRIVEGVAEFQVHAPGNYRLSLQLRSAHSHKALSSFRATIQVPGDGRLHQAEVQCDKSVRAELKEFVSRFRKRDRRRRKRD